ncbi:hypothetical protein LTR56_020040 [Elasticomyces elasticus]|nr:hypothetical protein LTR56_020040 [Elasticomyces elasticus]KAK3634175.1 hypothetical protein LTR22_019784 [Elasticomyces elasticus]KAK4911202.1 hypothetical protein LTR49_020168 [Elasticomyces elasticus]KAK5750681.1 hypothetical protein LTS12_019212 [Elasticomyces elasticus]
MPLPASALIRGPLELHSKLVGSDPVASAVEAAEELATTEEGTSMEEATSDVTAILVEDIALGETAADEDTADVDGLIVMTSVQGVVLKAMVAGLEMARLKSQTDRYAYATGSIDTAIEELWLAVFVEFRVMKVVHGVVATGSTDTVEFW